MEVRERVQAIVNRYWSRYPNERATIADEGVSGNHYRVMLNWVLQTYQFEGNIHENQMRFERPVVKAMVEECVRLP